MTKRLTLFILALILMGCGEDAPSETAVSSAIPPLAAPTVVLPTPTLAAGAPVGTAVPPATPSPTPPPTATPPPATRIAIGQEALEVGNAAVAAEQFEASLDELDELTPDQRVEALADLGEAYAADGRYAPAIPLFTQLLDEADAPSAAVAKLAQAHEGAGDYEAAIEAWQLYLDANPEMSAYVHRAIAADYLALGDREQAIAAYEATLDAPHHYLVEVDTRSKLADYYLADGRYDDAIAQYDAIHDMAQTEFTKGQMTYLAGLAEIAAGNEAAGYARFQTGIVDYPRADGSYQGLIALVEAGEPVDEYQRGLVDYYADAYEPGIAAFNRALETKPNLHEAHLYLAWSYEALGNYAGAVTEMERYIAAEPEDGLFESAQMAARAGQTETAVSLYADFLEQFPESENASIAAWQMAELAPDWDTAVERLLVFEGMFPDHEDAAEALFRAGWAAHQTDVTPERALALWQDAVNRYPADDYGAAALIWLLREGETVTETAVLSHSYYPLRADDLINGRTPFTRAAPVVIPPAEGQAEAEEWLRQRLELEEKIAIAPLSAELAEDERLIVGTKLWEAGLFEAAKLELEALRQDVDDPLSSYQLALYFRDLGLYRSSILAAMDLLGALEETIFTAPKFIGQLAYPVYYHDLVLETAETYGYDPLLQFSLLRQESLFESFARSGAAAQGLSQVIPDTGAYIAQRLDWPDYVNIDLYKPYVGVTFGGYYLSEQLEAFDGDVHAALSAYNAGPGNAARWYGAAGDDLDLYVETVDFPETRSYIERIYSGYNIYRYLYGER